MSERAKWMENGAPQGDVVISTRVRLARNLSDLPFPGTMTDSQAAEVVDRVLQRVEPGASQGDASSLVVHKMSQLPQLDRMILVEKHMISPALAGAAQGAVVISDDQSVAIMVNEEDHLRIQSILPGLQLEQAYEVASSYDDLLESELPFAFHEEYGYLTACPTNAGTGMRASVMIHLPGLVTTGQIGKVLSAIGQFGLMARGLYGEGTQASGNMFQVSNQVTSGLSEEEIIRNLSAVVEQIVSQERSITKALVQNSRIKLEDKVHRALGTLMNARVLPSTEAMALFSDVRLGVSAGLVKVPPGLLTELLVLTQPASLQKGMGKGLSSTERDIQRAELVRQRLNTEIKEVDEK